MLSSAVEHGGLSNLLDDQFSIDDIGIFKADPATYKMVTDKYAITPQEVAFQSSNRWDIAGATAFGFSCNWINRSNQPDEYLDLTPKHRLSDLNGLLD